LQPCLAVLAIEVHEKKLGVVRMLGNGNDINWLLEQIDYI